MEVATDFSYGYSGSSTVTTFGYEKKFSFAHSSEIKEDHAVPCFFYGNIKDAYLASRCMSVLANTVSSHFAIAPGALAKLRDPIVSVGNDELLFEAFSSCNSVYARVDILKNGLDGEFIHSGCTNIDFNDETIRAFNAVSPSEKLLIGVGAKEVQFITKKAETTEKKVALPNRWIKGLGNVQVYLSEMELAFELKKIEAIQLFKTVPKTPIKADYYLCKTGPLFSFSPIQKPNSIKVGGIHRLNLLQNLIQSVNRLFIYKSDAEQSFAMVLDFGTIQMTYLFSNGVYRGFSGEGKQLEYLIENIPTELILGMNSIFKTNEVFNPTMISIENDIQLNTMQGMQATLSSVGLLGFNLYNNQYFYRRLPFKMERLLGFNPRLKNAKAILEKGEIDILEERDTYVKAKVKGSADVYHTVIKNNTDYQCTCNWYTNHKNERGVCKHILALKMKED